jgi:hypothetical protein
VFPDIGHCITDIRPAIIPPYFPNAHATLVALTIIFTGTI